MFSYRVLSGISTIMCGQAAVIRCMNWIRRWGKAIARGEQVLIRPEHLQRISKVTYGYNYKHCNYCGYETAENFEYCPKCGKKF